MMLFIMMQGRKYLVMKSSSPNMQLLLVDTLVLARTIQLYKIYLAIKT